MMNCAKTLGGSIPDEADITVRFDDSIVTDTAAEKAQNMAEVGIAMAPWEYRMKWYGEDENTAKARARGLQKRNDSNTRTSAAEGSEGVWPVRVGVAGCRRPMAMRFMTLGRLAASRVAPGGFSM